MDLDPIKQLQSLLDDRSQLLEKISSIQSVLGSLKPTESIAPEPAAPATGTMPEQGSADIVYSRLQTALRDIQSQIEQRIIPIARQVVESEVARLREQSGHNQAALNESVAQIDQCILTCIGRLDEYQKRHKLLTLLNQRLTSLGAMPEPMPVSQLAPSLDDMFQSRLDALRHQAKH